MTNQPSHILLIHSPLKIPVLTHLFSVSLLTTGHASWGTPLVGQPGLLLVTMAAPNHHSKLVLKVSHVEANDMPETESWGQGKQDPYCLIKFSGQEKRTKTVSTSKS